MTMTERKDPEQPWSFPVAVADIPETGRHVDIVADGGTRAAIADAADLAALPRLVAGFDLMRHGADGLRVVGRVQAAVVQNCVVTLEPIESAVDEEIDLLFLPEAPTVPDVVELEASRRTIRRKRFRMAWSTSVPWPLNFCFWESIPIPASPARFSRRRRRATRRAAPLRSGGPEEGR